ncbi:hypothetical protein Tco_0532235 [Tanacetum coccineum]
MHSQPMYQPDPYSAPFYNQQGTNGSIIHAWHHRITHLLDLLQSSIFILMTISSRYEGAASQPYQPFPSQDSEAHPNPFETTLSSRRYKSGANESYYYDLAHKEYRATYGTTLSAGKFLRTIANGKRRDMSKKKATSSIARLESSTASDQGLVEALLNMWAHVASPLFSQRQESSSEYLRIR